MKDKLTGTVQYCVTETNMLWSPNGAQFSPKEAQSLKGMPSTYSWKHAQRFVDIDGIDWTIESILQNFSLGQTDP